MCLFTNSDDDMMHATAQEWVVVEFCLNRL